MNIVSQNNKKSTLKSTQYLEHLMQTVLEKAADAGATDAVVTVSADQGYSVDVRMGEVENISFSEDQGVSVTIYNGTRMGSAGSSDVSDSALNSMVNAAYAIASVSAADPCFGLPDRELVKYTYPDLALCSPWDLTPEQAISLALRCESEALSLDKRITNSDGVSVSTYSGKQGYATSHGFVGVVDSSRHSLSCSLLASDSKGMQRDYDYTTARDSADLLSVQELASNAVLRTTARLNAQRLKTQKSPVVFSSRLSSGLFMAFISAISGGLLYRKQSFLCDSLGKMLFPKKISIYERPHILGGLGSAPFDGEGLLTRENIFVKDGVLHQYVLNSYAARKLGLQTTANSGGVFNLTVDATVGGLDEVLHLMGTGLLVTELMGHGVNNLTGDYSRGASGFWVENGEIQYPVEEITIAGNLKDMFQGIVAIGNDLNPNIATRVGSVLIDQMMIAGE